MEAAVLASKRSSCLRLQVGAVLTLGGRILVSGYNGALRNAPHCTPETCGPDKPCTNTVHAEANCIYWAAYYGIPTKNLVMYTTDSPCKTCTEAIIQAGLEAVVYLREYRDETPLQMLDRAGLVVEKYVAP